MSEAVCASCGKPRKGHNYRHQFVPTPAREFVTIKVPKSAREAADKLVAVVSSGGWQALGLDRTDPVSLSSIFEEGIKSLDAARKSK